MWIRTEDDQGWTRPYRDILLDIVEHVLNRPAVETWPRLEHILGDDAEAFMLAVLRSGVRIERPAMTVTEQLEWEADSREARARHRFLQQQGAA